MSKVVGGLEYAIEREDIAEKTKDGKEKEKVSVKGNGTIINKQETGQEQVNNFYCHVQIVHFYTNLRCETMADCKLPSCGSAREGDFANA